MGAIWGKEIFLFDEIGFLSYNIEYEIPRDNFLVFCLHVGSGGFLYGDEHGSRGGKDSPSYHGISSSSFAKYLSGKRDKHASLY